MGKTGTIDIKSDAFARRLANLLRDRRDTSGASLRELARASDRAFNAKYLRAAEAGHADLDEQTVCELAALYGAELADILPSRLPLRIENSGRVARGIISTSGISTEFDPRNRDSLLTSYLFLVRQLRAQEREPIIDLRREDVDAIAEYLHEPGPSVLERLSTLMGATQVQRRAMAGMFIAGAIVIGLAGSGVAALTDVGGGGGSGATGDTVAAATATTAAIDDIGENVVVDTGGASVVLDGDDVADSDDLGRDDSAREIVVRTRPFGEPNDGSPRAFPPTTTAIALPPVVTPLPALDVTLDTGNTGAGAGTGTGTGTGTAGTGPVGDDAIVVDPPASGGQGGVATGSPPPPPTSDAAVTDPPVAGDAGGPAPDLTIPDLPFDLPSTEPPPSTAAPLPTDAPTTTSAPATEQPPPPPDTVAPGTTAPADGAQVAAGQPPVPPG